MRELYSVNRIHSENVFYWLKHNQYNRVLEYIRKYECILKPLKKGKGAGLRYYIWKHNLENFVRSYENGEIA